MSSEQSDKPGNLLNRLAGYLKHVRQEYRDMDGDPALRARKPLLYRALYHVARFSSITVREVFRDKIPLRAMALTYASMLTMVPLLILVFNVFQFFGGGEWFSETIRPFILDNLAPGTGTKVAERLQNVVENAGSFVLSGLGVVLLVMAVYTIFSGIEATVNLIWGSKSQAGSLQRLPLYWGLITIVPILMIGSFALTTYIKALPVITRAVEQVQIGQALLNRGLSMGMVILGLYLVYRFVPSTRVRNRHAIIAAIFAGILHELLKGGFIYYTTDLVQYDVIYGSLAAIPLLLIWVNLSWVVFLSGVEINFVAQHYRLMLKEPKYIDLSRSQQDAITLLMLYETTEAFRDNRKPVLLEEWSENWDIPPALATETVDLLEESGLIMRTGRGGNTLVLAKSPDRVSMDQVNSILSREAFTDWSWPDTAMWRVLKEWTRTRQRALVDLDKVQTLEELMDQLAVRSKDTQQDEG